MGQPSPPEIHRKSRTSELRWPGWVLILPVPFSLLALATVHDTSRIWAGMVIAIMGLLGWHFTRDRRKPSSSASVIWLIGIVALCMSALCFLPLTASQRATLQPGLAEPVQSILELSGAQSHSLALNPHEASLAWGWAAACLVLCIGVTTVIRTRRRSLRLALTLCVTGTGLVLLHGLQELTNATSILWISGIPTQSREAFLGTFVNPNHAGIFLAAILPISIPLIFRGESTARLFAVIGSTCIAIGIWQSGSRGALLSGLGGLLMMTLVGVQSRTRLQLLGGLGALITLFMWLGPETVFVSSSQTLMPGSVAQDSWSFRPQIWNDCLSLIGSAPWLGVGLGGFERGFTVVKSFPQFTTTSHAHGEAFQVVAETGWVTGILWILVLWAPLVLAWRQALRLKNGRRKQLLAGFMGGHTAIMLGCLVDFPLRIGSIAILFATICGVLLAKPGESTEPASQRLQSVLTFSIWIATLASLLPIYAFFSPANSSIRTSEDAVEAAEEAWHNATKATDPTADLNESTTFALMGLARDPLNHRLLQRLARAQVALQHTDDALYTLSLTQQAYPTLPWPWFAAARLYSHQGEVESARTAWYRGLSLDLPNPEEGQIRVQEALLDASSRAEVLAMIPERADRLRDAAISVAQRPDQELSWRLFARSSELDPRVNLAFANHLLRWGDLDTAWERIQLVPNEHCHTLRTSGIILLQLGRIDEAVDWLERALNVCGAQDQTTLNALAKARVANQDPKAPQLIDRLLTESPDSTSLRRLQLQVLRDKYQGQEMIPFLEELVLEGDATPAEEAELLKLYELHPSR